MSRNINYQRRGLNVTLIIQDETFRKLDTFKWNENNKVVKKMAIRTLKEKYGITFKPTVDADIDWLK